MKKVILVVVTLAMITTAFLTGTLVAVASSGTISIELDVTTAEVGDLINATIRVQNIESAGFIFTSINFNPDVLQVVNNDGYIVLSSVKTAFEIEGGNIGISPGQAISGEVDQDWNPIFWNGSFFANPQYPEVDNETGFIRLGFNSTVDTTIVDETLVTIHFLAIGEGDADIRFAVQGDTRYDRQVTRGSIYWGFIDYLGDTPIGHPQMNFPTLIVGEGDENFEIPPVQEPTEPGDGEDDQIATVTISPPSEDGDVLDYTISSRMIENNISRAFGVTDMSMNIRVEADDHINTIILRTQVSDVINMFDNVVLFTEFSTLLGRLGFEHVDVLLNMTANSQYVIVTISELYNSVMIDGVPMIPGGPAAQVQIPQDALGHWAENYIRFVVQNSIMVGFPDGTFRPNGSITRAEFSTAFARLLGLSNGAETFADTDEHWARGYIAAMAERGIVGGVGDDLFAPDAPITREQIAAIIHRAIDNGQLEIGNVAPNSQADFGDYAQISDWAQNAVYAVRDAGIMQGDAAGNFNPLNGATRAEVAAILTRILR